MGNIDRDIFTAASNVEFFFMVHRMNDFLLLQSRLQSLDRCIKQMKVDVVVLINARI
jgi:hypothetical protein